MSAAEDGPPKYNICVIGDGGVGKTAITVQYVRQQFLDESDPTIEDEYQKVATIDGEDALLNIFDTVGYVTTTYTWARAYDAYVVVLDIVRRSPEHSENILTGVLNVRQARHDELGTVLVFVGNKTDRPDERLMTYETGQALADRYNAPYLEISAKSYEETASVFELVVREMREKLPQYKPKPQSVPCSVM